MSSADDIPSIYVVIFVPVYPDKSPNTIRC